LARWQANWVTKHLAELGAEVQQVPISTIGDRQQDPIAAGSAVGVFTKELQRALLDGRIDLAVHSLKDLPTDYVEGLCLAAVPERAPVGDALISEKYPALDALPEGAAIATGSLRRRAQLLHIRPDLAMKDVRGNVDTRLRKLSEGQYDALILAEAGLRRLELADRIAQLLAPPVMLPAVGQGALGLETRDDDGPLRGLLAKLDHPATHAAVLAERTMLAELAGGCLAPIAAWGRVEGDQLVLSARVLDPGGTQQLESAAAAPPCDAPALGHRVAGDLLSQGAADLIRQLRGNTP
jgi:hydroxymethylbilane synthase